MLLFWLISKYLERLDDMSFRKLWERRVVGKFQRHLFWMILHFFLGVYLWTTILLWNTDSFLLEFVVFVFVILLYGGTYIRSLLRFISVQNGRYVQTMFGEPQDTFDKSNVVYEEKKR
jgi:hypothetical protein